MDKKPYNDKLDPEDQVDAEEAIAGYLSDAPPVMTEEELAQAGRDLLFIVLQRFRPDLID